MSARNRIIRVCRSIKVRDPVVRDATGQTVSVYESPYMWTKEHPLPRSVFDRIRIRLERRNGMFWYGPAFRWGVPLLGCALLAIRALSSQGGPFGGLSTFDAAFWSCFLLCYLPSAAAHKRIWPAAKDHILAHALLDERRCASCAYDLSTFAPNEVGHTTCPECGTAWLLPQAEAGTSGPREARQ